MAIKIGINGFGRIGRMVGRSILERDDSELQLVAVNDLASAGDLSHLLKYDSVHGRLGRGDICAEEDKMKIGGQEIKVFSCKDPGDIPWKDSGVDIVVESTGLFTLKEDGVNKKGISVKGAINHISRGGAKKVVISAPAKGEDITVVLGVNEDKYDPQRHCVISNASCTTNCLAPLAKVLNDTWGIEQGLMTTIHAYTNDQRVQDMPHSDMRRARAAALSMIPTSTGAAKAISLVIPELRGRLDGFAVRVPVANVSLVDLTCRLQKDATAQEINQALKEAAAGKMKGYLDYTEEPLVSSDFNHQPASSTVDAKLTKVIAGNFAKVVAWYDNEWGYSNRVVDLIKYIGSKGL
ncbi:MAG: type I glyceraldehyde-3-phosphate dehydrogenase [Candidatus Omnitrophota bacterium]